MSSIFSRGSRRTFHYRKSHKRTAWTVLILMVLSSAFLFVPSAAGAPVIQFTKTGPDSASVGDTITYTFTVKNTEIMEPLQSAKVTDPLFGAGWEKDLGTITAGQTKSFTKDYQVKPGDPDPLVNTATVSGTMGGWPTSETTSHSVDITGGGNPGIQVSKTGPVDALMYETVTYTIAVINTGNVDLTNVFVTDSLVSDFRWDVGNLAVGKGDYTHVKYTVTPESPFPLRNVAFAHGYSDKGEVSDTSEWTTKTSGLFGVLPNQSTRSGYQTYTGVTNLSGDSAAALNTYHGTDGASYGQGMTIPPYSRGTFNASNTPEMPEGDYTASVASDQSMAMSQSTFGSFKGQWPGAYGIGRGSSGTRFYLPNVCTQSGYYTYHAVQNVGDTPAAVNWKYYSTSGKMFEGSDTVPANARYTIGAQDMPGMPPGDYSAVITSDRPIAVSQSTFGDFKGQWPVAYGNGGSSWGTRFYMPNVCTQSGYYTYHAVQNVGDTPAAVNWKYYSTSGKMFEGSDTVPANARYTIAAHGTPGMPPGDYSAVVTSDQPIAVSQSTFGDFKGQWPGAYGSEGVGDPGTGFVVPNVCTRNGSHTYVAVQNAGDAPAAVNWKYYSTSGKMFEGSDTVPANARYTIAAHGTPGMPPGDYSAVVTSDQPIAVSQSTFMPYSFYTPQSGMVQKVVGYGSDAEWYFSD